MTDANVRFESDQKGRRRAEIVLNRIFGLQGAFDTAHCEKKRIMFNFQVSRTLPKTRGAEFANSSN